MKRNRIQKIEARNQFLRNVKSFKLFYSEFFGKYLFAETSLSDATFDVEYVENLINKGYIEKSFYGDYDITAKGLKCIA